MGDVGSKQAKLEVLWNLNVADHYEFQAQPPRRPPAGTDPPLPIDYPADTSVYRGTPFDPSRSMSDGVDDDGGDIVQVPEPLQVILNLKVPMFTFPRRLLVATSLGRRVPPYITTRRLLQPYRCGLATEYNTAGSSSKMSFEFRI